MESNCTGSRIMAEIKPVRVPRRKCDSGHENGLRIRTQPLFRYLSVVTPHMQRCWNVRNTYESLSEAKCGFRRAEKQVAAGHQR